MQDWRTGLERMFRRLTETPRESTGAWCFGTGNAAGFIFVEKGRVCWAAAPGRRQRLTDMLARAAGKSLQEVRRVCDASRETGRPLAESLIDAGLVDTATFRRVLLEDTCESLVKIAGRTTDAAAWTAHRGRGYAPHLTIGLGDGYAGALGVGSGNGMPEDPTLLDPYLLEGERGVVLAQLVGGRWEAVHARGVETPDEVTLLGAWGSGAPEAVRTAVPVRWSAGRRVCVALVADEAARLALLRRVEARTQA